jgi:phosphatidate cytidylyltransferase
VLAARIGTAAVLVGGFLAALFLLPRAGLAALAALLIGLAGYEWARLCRLAGALALLYAGGIAGVFAALAAAGLDRPAFVVASLFWIVAAPWWLWRGLAAGQLGALRASGFLVLVPAALAMLALSPWELLLVLVLIWVADTAAYFVGRRFGRRKLAPSISPGKTWEGAAGALAGALAYAIICQALVPLLESRITGAFWLAYLAAAAGLCIVSIVGDLFESAAKRQAAVKDSGTLLPGHGGVLDRIDSATSALPLAALLLPLLRTGAAP